MLLLFVFSCLSLALEPWYVGLNQFGPTSTDGWNARPMTRVSSSSCHEISLNVKGNDEFLFVSTVPPPIPPLGPLNWKQGKIGCGEFVPSPELGPNVFVFAALPGGQSGRYPASGNVTITVCTESQMQIRLNFTDSMLVRAPVILADGSSVVQAGKTFNVVVVADNFDKTMLNVKGGTVVAVQDNGPSQRVVLSASSDTVVVSYGTASYSVLVSDQLLNDGEWSPPVALMDKSGSFQPQNQPNAGWTVTPIHANVLGSDGKVLISGWLRRDFMPCFGGVNAGGRRKAGVSFVVDVDDVLAAASTGVLEVRPIDEQAECSFVSDKKTCFADGFAIDGDAIYCAGHTTLADGRVFLVGGGRYSNVSSASEREYGLNYARLFGDSEFRRVTTPLPLGPTWYPTAALLPSGRVLVTGAFSAYASNKCVGDSCLNSQINVFDVNAFNSGSNPWSVLINSTQADNDWAPGIREYTRVFVLQSPVIRGNDRFDVLLLGKRGRIVLINTNSGSTFKPVNGRRPSSCNGDVSDQSTFVGLSNNRVLILNGGCDDDTLSYAHMYDVENDSWTEISLGIKRRVPSATLLPNGQVILVSGEPVNVDQNLYESSDAGGDPRYVQILDPETKSVFTETSRGSIFRGYHNMIAVNKDGSILVGGGYNQKGDVGCEEPTLQVFRPSYISANRIRPAFDASFAAVPITLVPGKKVVLVVADNCDLDDETGVSLLAVNAFTHSYDQNARQAFLPILQRSGNQITVMVPEGMEAMKKIVDEEA